MFEKAKLKKQIQSLKDEIASIEQKRTRSQAALLDAILTNKTPSDEDTDFFNKYTQDIEELRLQLQELQMQAEKM